MPDTIIVNQDGDETILVQPVTPKVIVTPPASADVVVAATAAPEVVVTQAAGAAVVVNSETDSVIEVPAPQLAEIIVATPPAGPQGPAGADGADGAQGPQGDPGPGVASGGTSGQYLRKASAADYATEWADLEGLAPGAVGTTELADDAVTLAKLATEVTADALGGATDADVTALDGRVDALEIAPPVHAISHENGGSDEITLDQSQVTDLVADLAAKLPVSNPVALQTFTVNDATTPTKGYRFRTTGGALDLEVSNAQLDISVWDGPGFTGTQRNGISMGEDGTVLIPMLRDTSRLIGYAQLTSSYNVPATTSETTFITTGSMTFKNGRAYRMDFVANHQGNTGPTQPIKYATHKGTSSAGAYYAGYYYAPGGGGNPTPSTISVSQYLINETGSDIMTQVNMTVAFESTTGTARIYVDDESKCFIAFFEVGEAANFPFAKSIT